ncbi:MAG TPA: matrixin family metalloprotease [Armatimonadaceae bacterium]|nr:matrixin family metalloprotease [Armatimonadaceae bacterium]
MNRYGVSRQRTGRGGKAGITLAVAVAAVLAAGGVGCGGGPFSADDNVTVCAAGTFSPSYAEGVELARFERLPVTVAFTNRVTYGDTDLRSVLMAGFSEWAEATGGVLAYRVVDDPRDAQVVVTINVLDARPSGGGELASAIVTRTDRRIDEVAIRMDVWDGMTPAEVFDGVRSTAAHEFGHALGILDHSDSVLDVMYPVHGADERVTLSLRDVNTAKTAYCTDFGRAAGLPPCGPDVDCGKERGRGAAVRETVCGTPLPAGTGAAAPSRTLRLP